MQDDSNFGSGGTPTNHFRKKRRLLIALFSLVVILSVLVFVAVKWSSDRVVTQIEISGLVIIDEISMKSSLSDNLSKKREQIDLEYIERFVEKNPYVFNASASFSGNETLLIEIEERVPVAVLVRNDSRFSFIDKTGRILPYRIYDGIPDMPLIRGAFLSGKVDKKMLRQALMVVLRFDEEDKFRTYISEIICDHRNNSLEILSAENGSRVLFGNAVDFEEKFEKLSRIRKLTQSAFNRQIPEYIDVRWDRQIILKTEKA